MIPHVILVGASGKPADGDEELPAPQLWKGKLFESRRDYAERRAAKLGAMVGYISAREGIMTPCETSKPHAVGRPPEHGDNDRTWCHWQALVRAGLLALVEQRPEFFELASGGLFVEVHAAPTWQDALHRALPEHRVRFPNPNGTAPSQLAWIRRRIAREGLEGGAS